MQCSRERLACSEKLTDGQLNLLRGIIKSENNKKK